MKSHTISGQKLDGGFLMDSIMKPAGKQIIGQASDLAQQVEEVVEGILNDLDEGDEFVISVNVTIKTK